MAARPCLIPFGIPLNAEQEIRRRQHRFKRQSNAFLERIAFLLRKFHKLQLGLHLSRRYRTAIRSLEQDS